MTYLLDTSAISALMRADSRMASRLSSIGADDRVVVCAITRGEILFGIWIAAAAISLGATLVSSDRDFQSIAELAVVSL